MIRILNFNSLPLKEIIIFFFLFFFFILFIFFFPYTKPLIKKNQKYFNIFDHKKIGKLYLILSFLMLIRGFIDAFMLRLQQYLSFNHKGFLSEYHYCQIFTAHGVIMIFFVAMPFITGIMNIVIPLQIGSIDVAFPSLNLLSFWLTFFSSLLINISLIIGEFSKAGWLGYPPLTEKVFSSWVGVDYWDWSIQISGFSSIINSINFIITILKCRKKKNFFFKMPVFIWTCLCSNLLILISFPILSILLFQIFLDRYFNFHFFSSFYGGQSMTYVNLIWAWGHPEVYILILPSFGIFSEILSNICKKNIFSYNSLIYATISISILSFIVWLHHFFVMGAGAIPNIFFSISTMIIAIPTGVKIFNWLFTIFFSFKNKNSIFYWFISFIIIFCIGGFAGIILSIPNLDFVFHNSLFLIAHFHTVIIGGVLFGYLSGLQYWYPIIFNKKLSENISLFNIFFWLIGVICSFFPLYFLGYFGALRRTIIYFNKSWIFFFKITFLGSFFVLISIIIQLINYLISKKKIFNYRNSELLINNNFIINNINEFYYKKKYIENIFFIFIHKKSNYPFLISLLLFFSCFFLIWCFWNFFLKFIFILLLSIFFFINE